MLIYHQYIVIRMGEKMVRAFVCERCGHAWVPAGVEKPRVCPKCKSPYWDRPRRADRVIERTVKKEVVKGDRRVK
jgi:predicted Zn-ribbon and HTH transcriptional regulator